MVKKGDLIGKGYKNKDYMDVFVCVCADEETFVIGKAKFKQARNEFGQEEWEVVGASYENLRAFDNTEQALTENNLQVLN